MSAATIIFIDIAAFSQKNTNVQRQLVGDMNRAVKRILGRLRISKRTTLPTGDGMAIAIPHPRGKMIRKEDVLQLTLELHKWAHSKSTTQHPVKLRIGVHTGAISTVKDINGKKNICGHTVNFSQRVMDAANPQQVLFSDDTFSQLVGAEGEIMRFPGGVEARFVGPIDLYAKHGKQILVHKLTLNPTPSFYSNDDPLAKHLMMVSLTPLPKEIVGTFSARLSKARDIAFIQLTGDRFLDQLDEGEIKFSKELQRFWVFMPAPKAYRILGAQAPFALPALVNRCVSRWKSALRRIKRAHPNANIKLGLFKEPPYLGASFINWDAPGGHIHVSPYVWGLAAKDCPGYDVEWIGFKRPEIYNRYVIGLEHLNTTTKNII